MIEIKVQEKEKNHSICKEMHIIKQNGKSLFSQYLSYTQISEIMLLFARDVIEKRNEIKLIE